MKQRSGEIGSGFIFDFKPLYLVTNSISRIPSELSSGVGGRPVNVAGIQDAGPFGEWEGICPKGGTVPPSDC